MSIPDLLDKIGRTPLAEIKQITKQITPARILAKLEWFNPGGSVKDRAAFRMITEGEKSGKLIHDKIILDATSGNTGIAYAMVAARKKYRVQLVVPQNISGERAHMLSAYGAELIYSDPKQGSDGAIRKCLEIYKASPGKYFFPDQYNNDENWRAHYDGTGPEIWEQTRGKLTHFVAGLGTSGTFMGTGRFLKEKNKNIRLIAAQPDSPFHGLEGWKHMPTNIKPGFYDPTFPDDIMEVSTEEAYRMTKRLAKEEGLFAGVSAGAAMAVSLRLAQKLSSGIIDSSPRLLGSEESILSKRSASKDYLKGNPLTSHPHGCSAQGEGRQVSPPLIVVIFPDGGDRYLNEKFWKMEE